MNNLWNWILPVCLVAVIFAITCRVTIGNYFKQKEQFVDRYIAKLKKGATDGKSS